MKEEPKNEKDINNKNNDRIKQQQKQRQQRQQQQYNQSDSGSNINNQFCRWNPRIRTRLIEMSH